MKNYYDILEISEQASEADVKKAYFSMVRRYTPERDPLKFRQIREAYEAIKAGPPKSEPVFTAWDNPLASKLYNQIKSRLAQQDFMRVITICEEALHHCPKELIFRYYMAVAERQEGYTGKAVKNCELLVAADPDNRLYHRELAMAYIERGYKKKAIAAYTKAYAMGNDDPEFMIRYAQDCEENDRYNEGLMVLLSLIEEKRKWKREEIIDILEAYTGACILNEKCTGKREEQIGKDFLEFLREYTAYIDENAHSTASVFLIVMKGLAPHIHLGYLMNEIYRMLEKSMYTEEGLSIMKQFKKVYLTIQGEGDERLGKTIKRGLQVFLGDTAIMNDSLPIRYGQMDVKLCMIEEMPDILEELSILQTDYPEYYNHISEFAEALKEGKNLPYLKEKLKKEYDRMDDCMSGGQYYNLYPQERKGRARPLYDDDMPFVREGRKIGRNDPCPCGSGKKYKQCCGKNG